MKYFALVLGITLALPALSSAEIVISNSGSIQSDTHSSASSGGNSVDHGHAIITGDASASSKSEVSSHGEGTDVHIETSTTVNGETKTQTIEKKLKAGEPVSVEVNSKAVSGKKAETSVKVNNEELAATSAATVTAETVARVGGEEESSNVFVSLGARITLAIKNIFSIFKFW